MARVSQEFWCDTAGGGCGGYIRVRLNMALNHIVKLVCPNCGHEHQRKITDGRLVEHGRYATDAKEILRPTKAAYSKTPFTEPMKIAAAKSMRPENAKDAAQLSGAELDDFRQRWLEVAARERGEDHD